jgi:hypothetical protein
MEGQSMYKIFVLKDDDLSGEFYRRIYLLVKKDRWTRAAISASVGLAGGLLSIIVGTFLWIVVHLLTPGRFGSVLNKVEILFFALSLPLLSLGAYCLDLLEKKPPILPLASDSQFTAFARWPRFRPQYPHKN